MRPVMSAVLAVLGWTLVFAGVAAGQVPDPETRAKRDELERRVVAVFNRSPRDLDEAERLLREWIALRPMEFVPVYNLACVLALKGSAEAAETELLRAVELGFTDRRVIERDDNLDSLRGRQVYQDLLRSWPKVLDKVIEAREARYRATMTKGYRFERDEAMRLSFVSGFDPDAFAKARAEIAVLARWWTTEVLPEGTPAVVGDEGGPDGAAPPDPWVLVVLPNKQDFRSWSAKNFGTRSGKLSRIGGVYDNDKKELVSGDLGPSFRHELMHVMHWRHNSRTGRVHPIWVQEGLCSLVEDYRVEGEGDAARLIPVPSWRTNSLKKRMASGKVSIATMIAMPREKFSGNAPLANYALARAAFLYLSEKGKLREWYAAYDTGFAADSTGKQAFEKVLGKPMAQIDKEFRVWLAKLPEGPEYSEEEPE